MIYNTTLQYNKVLFKISFNDESKEFDIEKFYQKEKEEKEEPENENPEPEPEPEPETGKEEPEPEPEPEQKGIRKFFEWKDED